MKLQLLLVALVALSTRAAGAQIIVNPSSASVSPSVADSPDILAEPGQTTLPGYENLTLAGLDAEPGPSGTGRSRVPEPALYVIAGVGSALLTIGLLRHIAIRRIRRALRRRKHTEREMAYI